MSKVRLITMEIILSRLEPDESGCLIWRGTTDNKGYGVVRYEKKIWKVHRLIYTQRVGPIPDGFALHHICNTPPCAEPTHLKPILPGDHIFVGKTFAAANRAKTHCPSGHPYEGDNLIIKSRSDGTTFRLCRICTNAAALARYYRIQKKKQDHSS